MKDLNYLFSRLIDYAEEKQLIEKCDRTYISNRLSELFRVRGFLYQPKEIKEPTESANLENILSSLCDYAYEHGITEGNSVVYRDLFDTKIMGLLTPPPHEVISKFRKLHDESPELATDYFYSLSVNSDYIRSYRIKKDVKWKVNSEYGEIDISINLSKPEKDPKAIAAAKNMQQSNYPKCALCHENEGYEGSLTQAARQTLRQIPMSVGGSVWYLQYSPYVYYNEHCILLSSEHTPMKICRATFERMLDFIDYLPHYTIGSNADLPIVGGSILTHDHMQGGRYEFAMERASSVYDFKFDGYSDICASVLKWPLSVIRLTSENRKSLVGLADRILSAWRGYTDESAFVYAVTNGEEHNTITPIARMKGGKYQLDLVLRNNITTEEHPLGVYHPHSELHNIKKENIGLIEVMGLAVLPARLKSEMAKLADMIRTDHIDFTDSDIAKHEAWFNTFRDRYDFTTGNADEILKEEIGRTFVRVLCDAGVYKCTEKGLSDIKKFISYVNLRND